MTSDPVASVAHALRLLCFRAGVSPDDGSAAAGKWVLDRCRTELTATATDAPDACPVSAWLSATFPHLRPLLSWERVVLPTQRIRLRPWLNPPACVELPAALKAAVRGWDKAKKGAA